MEIVSEALCRNRSSYKISVTNSTRFGQPRSTNYVESRIPLAKDRQGLLPCICLNKQPRLIAGELLAMFCEILLLRARSVFRALGQGVSFKFVALSRQRRCTLVRRYRREMSRCYNARTALPEICPLSQAAFTFTLWSMSSETSSSRLNL